MTPPRPSTSHSTPTRVERARAVYEKERIVHGHACVRLAAAVREVDEAEKEAATVAQPAPEAPLPEGLVSVARALIRDVENFPGQGYSGILVTELLARSHGISVDALRKAIGEGL